MFDEGNIKERTVGVDELKQEEFDCKVVCVLSLCLVIFPVIHKSCNDPIDNIHNFNLNSISYSTSSRSPRCVFHYGSVKENASYSGNYYHHKGSWNRIAEDPSPQVLFLADSYFLHFSRYRVFLESTFELSSRFLLLVKIDSSPLPTENMFFSDPWLVEYRSPKRHESCKGYPDDLRKSKISWNYYLFCVTDHNLIYEDQQTHNGST